MKILLTGCAGFVGLMNQDKVMGPMNIGNPNEFTIMELAQKVIELIGRKSSIARCQKTNRSSVNLISPTPKQS